ncbi:hypothetical protein RHMOL_Rhmol11G0229100 [Rhododendron molle]|uniref:Uncharacterized protein n=1 Tax=Rhododendron molle TaxID=49168 RepID=A0ACC0LWK0_RHOML|nr:hypothetical protein RHMOL_Rhmol11G0229100 [Rhododendron molle]
MSELDGCPGPDTCLYPGPDRSTVMDIFPCPCPCQGTSMDMDKFSCPCPSTCPCLCQGTSTDMNIFPGTCPCPCLRSYPCPGTTPPTSGGGTSPTLPTSGGGTSPPPTLPTSGGTSPTPTPTPPTSGGTSPTGIDISNPYWAAAITLGFEHHVVRLGTTVIIPSIIVPLMGGGQKEKAEVIQTSLFVAGLNTLLQTWFGTRLPVVIGSSYSFIAPALIIVLSDRYSKYVDPLERFEKSMRGIQGAMMIASIIPILLGFFGIWRIIVRLITPVSAVPLVTLVGLGLYAQGFPQLAERIEIGLPELIILIILSQVHTETILQVPKSVAMTNLGSLVVLLASAGLDLLQFCNFDKLRTKFIIGFSIFMGLSVPQYFYGYMGTSGCGPVHTHANWFDKVVEIIFTSPATVAAIMIAVFLDCTIPPGRTDNRVIEIETDWWEAAMSAFEEDPEFFSLPLGLSECFPSV